MSSLDASSACSARSLTCLALAHSLHFCGALRPPMQPPLKNALMDSDASFANRERVRHAVDTASAAGPCGGRSRRRPRVLRNFQSIGPFQSNPTDWYAENVQVHLLINFRHVTRKQGCRSKSRPMISVVSSMSASARFGKSSFALLAASTWTLRSHARSS